MAAVVRANKVTAVLLAGTWHPCTAGSFKIDNLDLREGTLSPPEAEDYGFSFTEAAGTTVVGRLSQLIAVRMTA